MEGKYLIITDLDFIQMRDRIVKNDLVLAADGKFKWIIDLENQTVFAPSRNSWLPFKDFPLD